MNFIKTTFLLAAMTALFVGAGFLLGGQQGMVIAFAIAIAMNFFSYWYSDKILLKMYGAREETSGHVYQLVDELVRDNNMPMPKVYIIDEYQPNAFATGRNPQNAAVAVTTGIMQILNERELRGVLAHELAHIKNRDTLIMTLTATIAGAISMLANLAFFFGGGRSNENGGGNIIGMLLVMFLGPIAAMLVQMAISRTREYGADRVGAELAKDPLALASALEKLEMSALRVDNMRAENNPATAHMFIVNPLHTKKSDSLFSTHPSTHNRVEALRKMAI